MAVLKEKGKKDPPPELAVNGISNLFRTLGERYNRDMSGPIQTYERFARVTGIRISITEPAIESALTKQGLAFTYVTPKDNSKANHYTVPYHSEFKNRASCLVFESGIANLSFRVKTIDEAPDFTTLRYIAASEAWNIVSASPRAINPMLLSRLNPVALSRLRGPSLQGMRDAMFIALTEGNGYNFYEVHALWVPVTEVKKMMETVDRMAKWLLIQKEMIIERLKNTESLHLRDVLPSLIRKK